MQEIVPRVYIETTYPGVTLGAINWPHGLILIDAPFRPEDARSWRSALLNLGGGVDRLLVNLDSHLDRSLGVRAMDCTVVGHERLAQVVRNRPATFKAQPEDTGAEWELASILASTRWAPPEITFSQELKISWNGSPVVLEYRPGPTPDAIWVALPEQQVVFLGDAVVPGQPPFLFNADLDDWIGLLKLLLSPEYREWMLVSGRGGLVTHEDVRRQLNFLETVEEKIQALAGVEAPIEDIDRLAVELLKRFPAENKRMPLHLNRLRYGLEHYYARHYHPLEFQEGEG